MHTSVDAIVNSGTQHCTATLLLPLSVFAVTTIVVVEISAMCNSSSIGVTATGVVAFSVEQHATATPFTNMRQLPVAQQTTCRSIALPLEVLKYVPICQIT